MIFGCSGATTKLNSKPQGVDHDIFQDYGFVRQHIPASINGILLHFEDRTKALLLKIRTCAILEKHRTRTFNSLDIYLGCNHCLHRLRFPTSCLGHNRAYTRNFSQHFVRKVDWDCSELFEGHVTVILQLQETFRQPVYVLRAPSAWCIPKRLWRISSHNNPHSPNIEAFSTMSPSPQLAAPGSSSYSSNTMHVGDGTWDSQRDTFLLPNLVGLNFATMRYNGRSRKDCPKGLC